MPEKASPSLYSVQKTFIWFALAGITLTLSLILTVGQDYAREWKGWQRKFMRLKYEQAQAELKRAQEKLDREKLVAFEEEKEEAEKSFKAKKPEYRKLEKEIHSLDTELVKARSRYQDLKQYQDSYKYFLEEARAHKDSRAAAYEKKLTELHPRLDAAKLEVERIEKAKEEKEEAVALLRSDEEKLEKEIERLTREIDLSLIRLKSAKPSLAKELLNLPMLDFLRPTLQIQQVVLEDLYDDYHFTKVQKVDRCTTCHLGIDQKGFEEAPQPFRTHPKLDLFVGSDSPHALEKFGCTICHGGNGHSVSFKDSAHTPQNPAEAKEWEKKYGWHVLEKWEAKMLPLNHVEAACAKCHKGVVEIPHAEKLNRGRRLVQTYGCFACHKIEGFEERWKVWPSFEHLASKVDKAWVIRWLQDPKAFRPTTQMPRIFHLSNTNSPEDREKNVAAIQGIAAYLVKHSKPLELTPPPVQGDPKIGERLLKEVGCLGCHSVGDYGVNDFGPNLYGTGSKTTAEWLYTWLKNPKHYHEETRMPDLRLTDEEASHLVAYLGTLRNEGFDKQPLPEAKPEVVDEMVILFMRNKLRLDQAQEELEKMDPEAKFLYLGEKMIANQGCFGCHNIPGFKEAKPIGTELSHEGSKEVERLDFGFVPIERTRQAWFFQKLKQPRSFDEGKIRDYFEKLKMPDFGFTDEEAEALTTFLLSLVDEPIPLEMQRRLNLKELEVESGRLLVTKLNCQGCHLLEGQGGKVKELLEDPGLRPPSLEGEGAKVQDTWLYHFLKNPTTIRPWLKFRMPTFGFHHEELIRLVRYFTLLSGVEELYEEEKAVGEAKPTPEEFASGKQLFQMFQCAKCHEPAKAGTLGASFLAPDLTLAKDRLKPRWIVEWLKDPQVLEPGTMMPTFFPDGQTPAQDVLGGDTAKQIEALRDYLLHYEPGDRHL